MSSIDLSGSMALMSLGEVEDLLEPIYEVIEKALIHNAVRRAQLDTEIILGLLKAAQGLLKHFTEEPSPWISPEAAIRLYKEALGSDDPDCVPWDWDAYKETGLPRSVVREVAAADRAYRQAMVREFQRLDKEAEKATR